MSPEEKYDLSVSLFQEIIASDNIRCIIVTDHSASLQNRIRVEGLHFAVNRAVATLITKPSRQSGRGKEIKQTFPVKCHPDANFVTESLLNLRAASPSEQTTQKSDGRKFRFGIINSATNGSYPAGRR